MRWSDLLRKERVERWKTRWIVSYFDLYAREKNRRDFIGWNNNTWRGWVSMTEYAWNNNGRGIQTFRGGLLIYIYMFTSTIYCVHLYVSGPKENTSEWVVLFLRHSRDTRRSYKHNIYIYIYIYLYVYIYCITT